MIKSEILKLKNNEVFKRIYSKWRMRRQRDKTISLEMAQKGALWEYKELMKEQSNTTQTDIEEHDFYVRVGNRVYSNKKWKKLMALQAFLADTSKNPSPCWEDLTTHYLMNMFREDKKPSRKDKAVDLW